MIFQYDGHANHPGIYKITNTHNGRVYVGQTSEYKRRWNSYRRNLPKGTGHNKFLCNDYLKCKAELGNDDFLVFSVLEIMEGSTKQQRNEKEDWYISQHFDKQDSCYNFQQKSTPERSCYSKNPEETKRKISEAAKAMWANPEKAEQISSSIKEALSDPKVVKRKQEGHLRSWKDNETRLVAASKRMKERITSESKKAEKALAALKESQPKGRETFKKRMKEDTELRQKYVEIAKKKTEVLNERYKNDAEYRVMMDQKSIENIKEYNKIRAENMPVKAPLISPDGQIYSNIRSLSAFAKEHGLDSSGLYKLYSGKLNEVKGWKLYLTV